MNKPQEPSPRFKEASEFWYTHSKGVIGNCSKKSEAGGYCHDDETIICKG